MSLMRLKSGSYALLSIAIAALVACGGGGNSAADNPVPEHPRGLSNCEGSCYINAVLQLVLNSARLRQVVQTSNPSIPFGDFFQAYDSQSDEQLDATLYAVVNAIRAHCNEAGDAVAVLNTLLKRDVPWVSHDGIQNHTSEEYALMDPITYNDIPLKEKLNGFIYHKPGHWVAYISTQSGWYLADDKHISPVTCDALRQLAVRTNGTHRADETQMITVVSYR
ncbi:hypothetical protein DFQ30_001873 [Apophysomyces sp. BC1015]|nr:hypothetical protein DFQ30_001873 [Apophysomyces sp. BC1015]